MKLGMMIDQYTSCVICGIFLIPISPLWKKVLPEEKNIDQNYKGLGFNGFDSILSDPFPCSLKIF